MLSVICLAGPTGSGKSALAINLARDLGCEIINADSRQLYRSFPIVTAQPDAEEQSCVPHHLYGYLQTSEKTDAAHWADEAATLASEVVSRGRIPLLVGGTGFYFQILLRGIAQIPKIDARIGRQLTQRMEKEGSLALYAELASKDPQLASRIHPHDRQRVLRGLEVLQATGKPLAWWHARQNPQPLCTGPLFVLDVSLAELEPVLASRIDRMIARGARTEMEQALKECPDLTAPGWSSIGCQDALGLLDPACDLQAIRKSWLKRTRAYAKRQLTWFRGRKEAIWIRPGDAVKAVKTALGVSGSCPGSLKSSPWTTWTSGR